MRISFLNYSFSNICKSVKEKYKTNTCRGGFLIHLPANKHDFGVFTVNNL